MGTDFTLQGTSRVGPIEGPQIVEFSHPDRMDSSIMEDSKKYTKSRFMVANLLLWSYSNAIGLILRQLDELLILGY